METLAKPESICLDLIRARDTIKRVYPMESGDLLPVSANVFVSRGVQADEERLRTCKAVIKAGAGIFSNLRGSMEVPLAARLCISPDPREHFAQIMQMYDLLKTCFRRNEYTVLLAVTYAELVSPLEAETAAKRGRGLYERMKKEHPFLTSGEDSVMAGFMAFSQKDDDTLLADMEQCYTLLRRHFSGRDSLQSVSHVLAMAEGSGEEKTEKLIRLYDSFRDAGRRYGKYRELSVLAAASLLPPDILTLRDTILELDRLLAEHKGFHGLSMDKKTRLMYAAMLTADLYRQPETAELAISAAALAAVAAQQAAMCAVIASSAASSAAAHA